MCVCVCLQAVTQTDRRVRCVQKVTVVKLQSDSTPVTQCPKDTHCIIPGQHNHQYLIRASL